MPGERRHPTVNVKGAKPRERIRKLPPEEIEEASRIYLKERNLAMKLPESVKVSAWLWSGIS